MGIVYKAQDTRLKRTVALKFLPPDLTRDDEAKTRFVHEAQAASALQHNNICNIHDIDETKDGQTFIVMDCYEGETLKKKIERGPLKINETLDVAIQVAQGLAKAHEKGIVHRDVKPANILITSDNVVKIVDFGLAKLAGQTKLTKTGSTIGTTVYMSPEQARGEEVDRRTNIWSLGVIMYEMLTGQLPFRAEHEQAALYLILNRDPEPIAKLLPDFPAALEDIVKKAMAKDCEQRYQGVGELLSDLAALRQRLSPDVGVPRPRRRALIAALLTLIVAIVAVGGWLWWRQSRAHWARTVALPEATRLFAQSKGYAAFRWLRQAESYAPDDPMVKELLGTRATKATLYTTPPGAEIHVRDYFDKPDDWDFLGRSPLKDVLLPATFLVLKFSADGFETLEVPWWARIRSFQFALQRSADAPGGMVYVTGGEYELFSRSAVQLEGYWIDKYEVSNRQFKEFIDRGGYEKREYWTEPFIKDGAQIAWEDAMKLFRDRTGRPGPATWQLGTYPEGQDDYPVGGVSWYEAEAHCASVGKQLPSIYHWYNAAAFGWITDFISYSNFRSTQPERVGHSLRLGWYGTYDLAGNVKEWVWNEADQNRRYILGGGWNELSYQFADHDAQRAFDRQPTYGFRCAKYLAPLPPTLTDRVAAPGRDYRRETPVGDEAFAVYERLYRYDRLPLDARVDSADDSSPYWQIERVSFAAAYGNERVPALLFVPKGVPPPYQTVVWYPGANAFLGGVMGSAEDQRDWFLFVVRSGRAVLFPMYKGTYERYVGNSDLPHVWSDVLIHSSKDLGRAIDYLETRADIDPRKLAYYGLSMGAGVGPIMTAIEPRFKASILAGGGLYSWRRAPEVEAFNFLPRVHVPTLMINGRHDFYFGIETSQKPMFRLLGTKPEDKRHRVFESGHIPVEWDEVIREVLDWLDKYLGPVSRR
ncbi:MAG: serine/threonine protein kinase [Bacteroidetes bacterium]|nr:serine/threonine protein kinase [Bacteroidota bacterium]